MTGQPVQVISSQDAADLEPTNLDAWNAALDGSQPTEIVRWAIEQFGPRLCVTTSFTDTVLVHLATSVEPNLEVIFCDTGFHFAETLDTMKRAQARYRLDLRVTRPDPQAVDVWNAGTEACCQARKVDGLHRALTEGNKIAWLSGLRRADSPERTNANIVQRDRYGFVKVNPLIDWSDEQVATYVEDNDLVVNPLTEQGYPSVGCWPCTQPVIDGDTRSGRWSGSEKTECGLHR